MVYGNASRAHEKGQMRQEATVLGGPVTGEQNGVAVGQRKWRGADRGSSSNAFGTAIFAINRRHGGAQSSR